MNFPIVLYYIDPFVTHCERILNVRLHIQEVLGNIGASAQVDKVERLGKKRQDGKSRPVRVKFVDSSARDKAIKCGPKIRQSSSSCFNTKSIFITPDMTKLQRDDDVALRRQLVEKRKDDPNWVIRNGKLIKRPTGPQGDPGGST